MDSTLSGVESGNEKKSEEGGEANRVSTVSGISEIFKSAFNSFIQSFME